MPKKGPPRPPKKTLWPIQTPHRPTIGALLVQHEAFSDRQNNLLGPFKAIRDPHRSTKGPLRAAQALPHRQIALLGRKRAYLDRRP